MKKLLTIAVVAAALCGCSVTKVNYERDETGKVSYRLYRNDHWLKTSGTGLSGGMTKDGKFEFAAEGLERSPSEEFNRVMMTYTTAFVQLAQIAAAAYNPSASAAAAKTAEPAPTVVNVQPTPVDQSNTQTTKQSNNSPECTGDDCKAPDCPDCKDK